MLSAELGAYLAGGYLTVGEEYRAVLRERHSRALAAYGYQPGLPVAGAAAVRGVAAFRVGADFVRYQVYVEYRNVACLLEFIDVPLGFGVRLEAHVVVEMFREDVQQHGYLRGVMHELELMAAHLADRNGVRGHFLEALQRRNSDVAYQHGFETAGAEEVIGQRGGRGLPLCAGYADNFTWAKPEQHLGLGEYPGFFLVSQLILDDDAWALQEQVVALCAVEAVLAVYPGDSRYVLRLHVRDCYLRTAAEPVQQREPHSAFPAVAQYGAAFSFKKGA